jgi:hypothetical protein
MRRNRALIAATAVAVAAGIGVSSAGAAYIPVLGPFDAPKMNVRHLAMDAEKMSVAKRNGSYVVTLRDVSDHVSAVRARKGPTRRAAFRVKARALPEMWTGRLGFNPNVAVTYRVNGALRTHYLRDADRASYNAKTNSITTVVPANAGNIRVVKQMRPRDARSVRAVFEPSPMRSGPVVPGRKDPAREMQTSSTAPSTGFVPAAPNSTYSIPYTTAVGTGGQTWRNLYSANGQIAPNVCESFYSSQSGGTATTIGSIQLYETAAEVQQAMSIGASITYKVPLAKVTLDLGYSASSAANTSSFYAVALASWQGAYVNLGAPTLSGAYSTAANSIFSMSDAFGVMQNCGDSFPTGYQQGATWASILQIKFSSEQQAQSAYASMKETVGVSFASTSATQSFSTGMSKYASSSTITEIDQCWGITNGSCPTGIVPGYVAPSSSSVNYNTAMSVFTGNYNAMYSGLANKCTPTLTSSNCATTVQYAPLQQAFGTANFSQGSPSQVFTQAAEGVYGVIQNFQAWESQYQAMITGNPTNSANSAYQANIDALNTQADDCMSNLQDQTCSTVFQQCAYGMMWNPTYVQAACQPTAFSSNLTLANMQNPYMVSNTTQPGS